MTYRVSAVLPGLVDLLWADCVKYLQAAIDQAQGETNTELTRAQVISGDAILVVIYKESKIYGAAVVRKRDFDTGVSAVSVGLLGGVNMPDWIDDAFAVAKEIGIDLGCTKMYCTGRTGWEKALGHLGFEKAYTTLIHNF